MCLWFALPLWAALIITVLFAMVMYLLTMFLILVCKIPDMLATCALQFVHQGLGLAYTGGSAVSAGLGGVPDTASAWHLADTLGLPVLLVVPAKGASLTLAAQINGLKTFRTPSRIVGVNLRPDDVLLVLGLSVDENLGVGDASVRRFEDVVRIVPDNREAVHVNVDRIGDEGRGGATVSLAMGDGRRAAAAMNEKLKG